MKVKQINSMEKKIETLYNEYSDFKTPEYRKKEIKGEIDTIATICATMVAIKMWRS